jgi:hypothetical protein
MESQITEGDIAAAPPDKRPALEDVRRRGRLICGRVGNLDLNEEEHSSGLTPAVPFATAFTGVVGADRKSEARAAYLAALSVQLQAPPFARPQDALRRGLRVRPASC